MAFLNNFGFGGANPLGNIGGFQNNNIYGPGFGGIGRFGMPMLQGPRNGGANVISQNQQNGGGASNISVTPTVAPRPSILSSGAGGDQVVE